MRFIPRNGNTQLVEGWARTDRLTGRVTEALFEGEYDMVRFRVEVTMGHTGVESLLPRRCCLNARFRSSTAPGRQPTQRFGPWCVRCPSRLTRRSSSPVKRLRLTLPLLIPHSFRALPTRVLPAVCGGMWGAICSTA